MITKIKKIYFKQLFEPNILGIFINPIYFIKKGIYKGIKRNSKYLNGIFLDFGCGQKPYKDIIHVQKYIGLDIEISGHSHENEEIDVYYDGNKIPFENNYFDSILASEVFEHLFNLEEIIKELFRVIKKDGHLLITIPFVYDEHETPYDFARYTSFGIKHLLEKNGFKVIKIEKSTNYLETVFQMFILYIYQFIFPKNKIIKTILVPIIIFPLTTIGIILSKILPKNNNLYNNLIILAKK